MKNGNRFFGQCMACYYKYAKCKKKRISRIQKKELKKFLCDPFAKLIRHNDWMGVNGCDIRAYYKEYKTYFNMLIPYRKIILQFTKLLHEYSLEQIYINEKGRLCWYWESDDDYGGSSGIMPFCYSEEEADKTWAYSEMHSLFYCLYKASAGKMPHEIQSDKQLLEYFKANPFPAEWSED